MTITRIATLLFFLVRKCLSLSCGESLQGTKMSPLSKQHDLEPQNRWQMAGKGSMSGKGAGLLNTAGGEVWQPALTQVWAPGTQSPHLRVPERGKKPWWREKEPCSNFISWSFMVNYLLPNIRNKKITPASQVYRKNQMRTWNVQQMPGQTVRGFPTIFLSVPLF